MEHERIDMHESLLVLDFFRSEIQERATDTSSELVSKSLICLPTKEKRCLEEQLVSTVLTNYLTKNSSSSSSIVSKQIENLVSNLEEFTTLLKEIGEILKVRDVIKASIFLFLLKHKVIWGGAMRKIFPGFTARQMIERFRSEERKGFCYELTDGDGRFEREKKKLGKIIEKQQNASRYQVDRVRWFGVTNQGLELIKLFRKQLTEILTEDIYKKINDPRLSFLFHTHKEHEWVERQKQRAENRELKPILFEICALTRMSLNEVNRKLQNVSERTGERRLTIAKRWLKDLKKEE